MSRAHATVPPEAIRIEDEVWQEAFARREPARPNRRRLEAIEGGRPARATASASVPAPQTAAAAPRSEAALADRTPALAPPVRRTVTIQGRGAERHLPIPDASRRRPSRRAYERSGFRPDRVAMWAVFLGLMLVLVAIASGHS